MKYKIDVSVINKICYQMGRYIEDMHEMEYLEKLLFTEEEIKLGYRTIEVEDIYVYITKTLEPTISKG